jgi:hypothetical protein
MMAAELGCSHFGDCRYRGSKRILRTKADGMKQCEQTAGHTLRSAEWRAGRYSPPHVVRSEKTEIVGNPDQDHISTSLAERQNLTMRISMRRFTRLTNGFSKKVENHRAAVNLHFAPYNFVRVHSTIRYTPAMAAGVSRRLWTLEELVDRVTI